MEILFLTGIVLICIAFILFYAKLRYIHHKLHWLFLILLFLFIYISFTASIGGQNLDLKTLGGWEKAGNIYWNWLGNAFDNAKSVTTHAIKLDWNIPNIFKK
jgi:hypothetical protein